MKLKFAAAALVAAFAASTYATSWTYSATDQTITDGQWTLGLRSFDYLKSSGTICFTGVKGWSKPDDESKSGVLDLRKPLLVDLGAGDAPMEFAKVKFNDFAFKENANLVEFYCDIMSDGSGISDVSETGYFMSCDNLTKAELGGPAETLGAIIFNRCKGLKTVKLAFPNLRKIKDCQGSYTFLGADTSPDPIDISTVAVPCVTNIGAGTLAHAKLYGDVFVTNLMFLGKFAFSGSSITNVHLAGTIDSLNENMFKESTVTNVVLDFPNLTNVAGYVCYNLKTLKSDVMDILKPGVVAVGNNAFYNCYELTGTLTLTNVQTIGANAFYACKGLSEIYLAGPCAGLGSQAFYECEGLKRATFDLAENATVGSKAFGKWSPPAFESIRFLRKPFDAASMTNLLFNASGDYGTSRPLTAENACKVYVSKLQWPLEERQACEWWRPATAETLSEEELAAKPQGCIGVAEIVLSKDDDVWSYRRSGTTQRAWIVHQASPYDKAGMIIVVR